MAKVKSRMTAKEYQEYLAKKDNKKSNKLGNERCEHNGIKFQSKLERDRYVLLLKLEKSGAIRNLELQPKFKIQESYKARIDGVATTIKRISYSADFRYIDSKGRIVVEDTKGHKTDAYKRAIKLALPIMFKEGVDVFIEVLDYKATKIKQYQRV